MLNKKDLLENVEEKYIPMLKEVNIIEFTKCIAQYSGLNIQEVNDDVIKEYLLTWAKNKYRFYEMLGNKMKVDTKIQYNSDELKVEEKMNELKKGYPAYALWLDGFKRADINKIYERHLSYMVNDEIKELFPNCNIEGSSITHFFKKYLEAPDKLVTELGRIWENQTVEANYTISIDPVDMMFASENPYGWTSCYRLEICNEGLHADGCLAAILDNSSLITYVWNKEGKFSLYNKYDFKNIRYYRMRQWISISPNANAIHFNAIYPGKGEYGESFAKTLREKVENLVNKDAIWQKNDRMSIDCMRKELYGYGEFNWSYIYKIKDTENEKWQTYTEKILCPCGCGQYVPGSDDDDDCEGYEYSGDGYIAENFFEKECEEEWCDYADDYCQRGVEDCDTCSYWNRYHPVCELDNDSFCNNASDAEDDEKFDPYEDNIVHCGDHCEGCIHYKNKNNEEKKSSAIKYFKLKTENLKTHFTISTDAVKILYDIGTNDYGTCNYVQGYPDEDPTPRLDI